MEDYLECSFHCQKGSPIKINLLEQLVSGKLNDICEQTGWKWNKDNQGNTKTIKCICFQYACTVSSKTFADWILAIVYKIKVIISHAEQCYYKHKTTRRESNELKTRMSFKSKNTNLIIDIDSTTSMTYLIKINIVCLLGK